MTMAERELADEQNEAAHRQMHERPQKEGTAGWIDPTKLQPWHNREQEHLKEEQENG
jgi:hypothetical protein